MSNLTIVDLHQEEELSSSSMGIVGGLFEHVSQALSENSNTPVPVTPTLGAIADGAAGATVLGYAVEALMALC